MDEDEGASLLADAAGASGRFGGARRASADVVEIQAQVGRRVRHVLRHLPGCLDHAGAVDHILAGGSASPAASRAEAARRVQKGTR